MKRLVLSFLIYHFAFSPAGAQTPWTLEQCCDYAVAHNIGIRQKENQRQQQELQVSNARNRRLPDLNGSVGENFSFGRGLTAENTYSNTNTSSTSLSLSTSVPLFTGFEIPNQIRLSRLNLEAATQDLEKAKNDIRIQVAQSYVQVLYDMELLDVARRQVDIDSAQVARLQSMLNVGKTSEAELSRQRATLAQSRLTATQADNNLRLELLALAQLLELDSPEGFSIARPQEYLGKRENPDNLEHLDNLENLEYLDNLDNLENLAPPAQTAPLSPDLIFVDALATKPEIRTEQIRLQATERAIDIARAGYYPTLSFSAGLGTNYYTTSGHTSDPLGRQLKNNFSQYLGLSLNIPIFNRLQTRNSVRSARLDRLNQQLALDNAKKTLYKEIQQAWYNAVASGEKLRSSRQARQASQDAFRLTQAKYENGKATITEFNEAKNNLMKTESDLTQARYENLYQRALLKFYRGEPLRF